MARRRSRIFPFALVALLVALAAGAAGPRAGQAQDEEIELLVWDLLTDEEESATVDRIYEGFTEQNPNITIRREVFSTDQMRQTVNTAIASGTGPDIILYDAGPGFAGVLANAGLLTPLDDYAAQYGWTERVAPSSLEATSLGGQLYGLPLQVDLIGMYYNQTLIEQEGLTVPETVEQMLTFCQEAAEKGYIPIAFSNNPGWQAGHQFSMTSNQMIGPDAMRQYLIGGQANWNTPEIVTAIEAFFVDMRDAGCYSEDANAITYDDGNSLFLTGQSLLHTTGSWMIQDVERSMGDFEVGFVPFPEIAGGTGRLWVSGVGSAYYITSTTENPDEAAMFLDYLFSPEVVAQQWVGDARFVVPVQFDASALELSPLFRSMLDVLQTAAAEGTQFGYNVDVLAPPEFNDTMLNGFQAMVNGDMTAEELAAALQAAWEEGTANQGTPQA